MCTTNCSHFLNCESRQGMYHCNCQAGFSGPHCDINIDDCSSSPCVNGKCEDGVNRYDCICNKGYWGTNCEKKINNEEGNNLSHFGNLLRRQSDNDKRYKNIKAVIIEKRSKR